MGLNDPLRGITGTVAFDNDPISTEMGDHWQESDLQDYFSQKGYLGDSVLGVNERANLDYTPEWTSWSSDFAEPMKASYFGPDPSTQPVKPKTKVTDPIKDPIITDPRDDPTTKKKPTWGPAFDTFSEQFKRPAAADAPYPDVPVYRGPDRPEFTDFTHDKFQAPTLEEARRDPGFEFRMKEGLRALENSGAAKGMSRSGQQAKGLMGWAGDLADTTYGNVYGRAKDVYGMNYGLAKDIHQDQRRNLVDAYGMERQEARDVFAPKMQAWPMQYQMAGLDRDQEYDRAWQEYENRKRLFDEKRDIRTSGITGLMGF